jgi:hypothetical protein
MQQVTSKKLNVLRVTVWLLTFLLWLDCYRGFYPGTLLISADSPWYFERIKYYLENITRGVYPFWDPFYFWGRPGDLAMRFIGEFNPLLFIIIIFQALGLSFAFSYFLYLLANILLMGIGLYLLAKVIFQDEVLAYLAMILLLFSTIGFTLFNDNGVMLIVVPGVWFFYFFFSFCHEPRKPPLLGLTFTTMVILITYMPFYTLTVFLFIVLCYLLLYFSQLQLVMRRCWQFFKDHKSLTLFCFCSVVFAALPGLFWFIFIGGSDDFVSGLRHVGSSLDHQVSISFKNAGSSNIIGPFPLSELFSNFADKSFGAFYAPLFGCLLLFLGSLNAISRRQVLLLLSGVFLVFLSMTDATPIYRLLFDGVIYFKFIRNLLYFLWLALPILVLFSVEQVRPLLYELPQTTRGRWLRGLFIVGIHLAAGLVLCHLDSPLPICYLTLSLSCLFFVAVSALGIKPRKEFFCLAFLLCVGIESRVVFGTLSKNIGAYRISYQQEKFTPQFQFIRPDPAEVVNQPNEVINARDTSGFVFPAIRGQQHYVGLYWGYLLQTNLPQEILKEYVKYKFVLYDSARSVGELIPLVDIVKSFTENRNEAFVYQAPLNLVADLKGTKSSQAEKISQNTPRFQVQQFDLNRLRLSAQFDAPKFLVYNDSYHRGWRAKVNGVNATIYRSNLAFKGIFLPAGKNDVEFSFGSKTRSLFSVFLTLYFWGFLLAILYYYSAETGIGNRVKCLLLRRNQDVRVN